MRCHTSRLWCPRSKAAWLCLSAKVVVAKCAQRSRSVLCSSLLQSDFTLLGDCINTASRVASLAVTLKSPLLFSFEVRCLLGDEMREEIESAGMHQVGSLTFYQYRPTKKHGSKRSDPNSPDLFGFSFSSQPLLAHLSPRSKEEINLLWFTSSQDLSWTVKRCDRKSRNSILVCACACAFACAKFTKLTFTACYFTAQRNSVALGSWFLRQKGTVHRYASVL